MSGLYRPERGLLFAPGQLSKEVRFTMKDLWPPRYCAMDWMVCGCLPG